MFELIENLAKENNVSENIIKMIIKEAVVNSVSEIYGTDKNYFFDIDSNIVTIVENNEVRNIKLSEIQNDKSQKIEIALSIRSKISKFLSEFNPSKKLNNLEKEVEETNEKDENTYNPYENFKWGGLNGEEAFVAYWNCD